MRGIRTFFGASLVLGCAVACSGGGTAPAPGPTPTLGGGGSTADLDRHVRFVVQVPPVTVLQAVATAAKRSRRSVRPLAQASAVPSTQASAVPSTPYVSPNTGSVTLTLATVDGVSLAQAPPSLAPIDIPAACQGSTAGCSVPDAQAVPAAVGVNRYLVQTFTGAQGTGLLVSSGFVDVTVGATDGTASIGAGTSAILTVGGYVGSIALSPASVNFNAGVVGDAKIIVQAFDPAGAFIVGAAAFENPIAVTTLDSSNFTLNGVANLSLDSPVAAPGIDLHYGGGQSFGTVVQANTIDGGGNAISATPVAVNVSVPSPSPTPPGATPTPRVTPTPATVQLSLYVDDAQNDRVLEYDVPTQIEAGTVPNPAATPRRVIQFSPPSNVSCSGPNTSSPDTGGVAVASTGSIYLVTGCNDATFNFYTFAYAATAVGNATPSASYAAPGLGAGFALPSGAAIDATRNLLFAGYVSNAPYQAGFSLAAGPSAPIVSIGGQCITELGQSTSCAASGTQYGFGALSSFAIDRNGFDFVPLYYNDPAPGAAATLSNPPAIGLLQASGSNQAPKPFTAIAGMRAELGGSGLAPDAVAVEGGMLYVLAHGNTLNTLAGTSVWPGLSYCPPPSANAPLDTPAVPDANFNVNSNCADQQGHEYLAGYPLSSTVFSAIGQDIELTPSFVIGGDTVGGFGSSTPSSAGGPLLAVRDGFAYVTNLQPCEPGASGTACPSTEIDVYDTRSLSGARTDIAPTAKLVFGSNVFPLGLSLGPTGTVTNPQALARPSRVHFDVRRYLERLRRKQLERSRSRLGTLGNANANASAKAGAGTRITGKRARGV